MRVRSRQSRVRRVQQGERHPQRKDAGSIAEGEAPPSGIPDAQEVRTGTVAFTGCRDSALNPHYHDRRNAGDQGLVLTPRPPATHNQPHDEPVRWHQLSAQMLAKGWVRHIFETIHKILATIFQFSSIFS